MILYLLPEALLSRDEDFEKEILKLLLEGDYRFSFMSRGMACIDNTGEVRKNKTKNSKANPCPPRGLLPKLSYK